MEKREDKLERLEAALRAVYRREPGAGPVDVDAVMTRVGAAAADQTREARFLSRFVLAAAVAASVLVVASVWSGDSPDAVALSGVTDSPWSVLIGPTLLN